MNINVVHHNRSSIILLMAIFIFISGCKKDEESAPVRPVRVVVIEKLVNDEPIIVTGQVAAHTYVNASFRTSGKMIERMASVGSIIKAGQPLARLDSEIEKNSLTAAKADLDTAKALLAQTQILEKRKRALVALGAVSQNDYDEALRQFKSALAMVEGAEAKLHAAQEQMGFTLLKAEKNGLVIEKGAEVGEVVTAGQMILRIAEGKMIDAVFDMPETIIQQKQTEMEKIEVCLYTDKSICAEGIVYEIAPQADSVTRTFLVKAAINSFPPKMLLGATVIGTLRSPETPTIKIPSSSLTIQDGRSAVWRVEPETKTVQLTPIRIERYTTESTVVAEGLRTGDIIVTAGVQELHRHQKVKLLDVGHGQN